MRHALVLVAFLGALRVAPASAQATDSTLVDGVVGALQIETTLLTPLGPMAGAAGILSGADEPPDAGAIGAALREALYADPQPDLLRQARAYLDGPAHAALLRRAHTMVLGNPVIDELRREVAEDPSSPLREVRRPLDTTLVHRFVAAQDVAGTMTRAMVGVREVLVRERPDLVPPGTLEEFEAELQAEALEASVRPYVSAALLGTDPDVLAQAVAFRESAAGQFLERARTEAFLDVYVPYFAALLIREADEAEAGPAEDYGSLYDEAAPTEEEAVELTETYDAPPSPPAAPPHDRAPAPLDDGSYVYDVVEVMPELVGGIAALQALAEYPAEAKAAGIEGRVFVEVVVDEEGRPTRARVLRSPHALLSDSALAAVRRARWTPGLQRGRAVRVRSMLPVTFRLR